MTKTSDFDDKVNYSGDYKGNYSNNYSGDYSSTGYARLAQVEDIVKRKTGVSADKIVITPIQ